MIFTKGENKGMENNLDFTIAMEDDFYSVVDNEDFLNKDAEAIYDYLCNKVKPIPFCDYLKRYILRKLNRDVDVNFFDLKFYQTYIIQSFNQNMTPKSFTETTTKTAMITKNWLQQASVSRKAIFLLGFGLGMTVDEVSEFLVKVQKEYDFNMKDPFEVICWYCYSHHLKYRDYLRIMNRYSEMFQNSDGHEFDSTVTIKNSFSKLDNEDDLVERLCALKNENNGKHFSVTTRMCFDKLYDDVREIIVEQKNNDEEEFFERKAAIYLDRIENSDKIPFEEKLQRASIIRQSAKRYTVSDITEGDVEKCLCCGIPFDEKGNLVKNKYSTLASLFRNKRMSRQHIRDIIVGKTDVDRFDLITLNFYIYAMRNEKSAKQRCFDFIENTNQKLRGCNMGEIYLANPYETFLLMCMLSDYPMGTYSDVLELSYRQA